MRMSEIQIESFGRLVNLQLELAPGFNLIYAPNDAGKSTLQQAILALLYGPYSEGAATPAEMAALQGFKPWNEQLLYAAGMTYNLENGKGYWVSRCFMPRPETVLRTHPGGQDISGQFKTTPEGYLSFAADQLGVSREVFENICVTRQGGLSTLNNPASVAAALKRVLASAKDVSVSQAISRLDAALNEDANPQSSQVAQINQAFANLNALQEERQRTLKLRRELHSRSTLLSQANYRLQTIERQREELQILQQKAEEEIARSQQMAALNELKAEIARCQSDVARWEAWAGFPGQLQGQVRELTTRRRHLLDDWQEQERRAKQAQQALQAIQAQEVALRARLLSLGVQLGPVEEVPEFDPLHREWRAASDAEAAINERWKAAQATVDSLERGLREEGKPLEPALRLGPSGLVAVQQRLYAARDRLLRAKSALTEVSTQWARTSVNEEQLQHLEAVTQQENINFNPEMESEFDDRQGQGQGRGILSMLLGRGERNGRGNNGSIVEPEVQALYASLLDCREEVAAARQALSDSEAAVLWQLGGLLGGTLEDSAFNRLNERVERFLRKEAEIEPQRIQANNLRAELDQARARREELDKPIAEILSHLGYDTSDLPQAVAAYTRKPLMRQGQFTRPDGEQERLRFRAESDLQLLRNREETLQMQLDNWQEMQVGLAELEDKLISFLAQAHIDARPATLEEGLERFEEASQNYKRWEKAKTALDAAVAYQKTLMETQVSTTNAAALLRDLDSTFSPAANNDASWPNLQLTKSPNEKLWSNMPLDKSLNDASWPNLQLTKSPNEKLWSNMPLDKSPSDTVRSPDPLPNDALRPDKSPEEYAALINNLDARRAKAREEYAMLEAALKEMTSGIRPIAEIDEEAALVEAEIRRLEEFRAAVQLARSELVQASQEFHQQFAPKLEYLLKDALGRFVSDRFSDLMVDPQTLEVSLVAPSLSTPVPATHLGAGMRDLIHLFLRISIARLINRAIEPLPLLLDEPLANCDRSHQDQVLEMLIQLASEAQILFFTNNETFRARFEKEWSRSNVHQVYALASA